MTAPNDRSIAPDDLPTTDVPTINALLDVLKADPATSCDCCGDLSVDRSISMLLGALDVLIATQPVVWANGARQTCARIITAQHAGGVN